jgi:hypothetical protein
VRTAARRTPSCSTEAFITTLSRTGVTLVRRVTGDGQGPPDPGCWYLAVLGERDATIRCGSTSHRRRYLRGGIGGAGPLGVHAAQSERQRSRALRRADVRDVVGQAIDAGLVADELVGDPVQDDQAYADSSAE